MIALSQGAVEQAVYRFGFSMPTDVLGKFIFRYHAPLFLSWILVCVGLGLWWFFPAFCVIQDWSWYRFHPDKTLGPDSWSNFGLGGFRIFGEWIPNSYILGTVISLVFYILK